MTSFILLQNVAYEGSSLKGVFGSLERALDHLNSLNGYCMDEWTCDRASLRPIEEYELERVCGSTAGWWIRGPADLSFTIFACVATDE